MNSARGIWTVFVSKRSGFSLCGQWETESVLIQEEDFGVKGLLGQKLSREGGEGSEGVEKRFSLRTLRRLRGKQSGQ